MGHVAHGGGTYAHAAARSAGRRIAVALGVSLAVGVQAGPTPADAQASPADTAIAERVTGTRIRQPARWGAGPSLVIDRAQIEATGVAILGDLLQRLPLISGGFTTPQINNGGGDGATTLNLRGMETKRTLVLLNGRRAFATAGASVDVNAIPINLVERVEILADGGSVIYGSGAVGGIVNIITREDAEGVEALTSHGESGRGDGARTYHAVTLGTASAGRSLLAGINFDRRSPVSAADRAFSRTDVAMAFGETVPLGSSATPEGVFSISRARARSAGITCPGTAANVFLRRREGASGSQFNGANWRCARFTTDPDTDLYDYQPHNLVLTPQRRFGAFIMGSSALARGVEAFAELFLHNTRATAQLAPEPVFGTTEGLEISASNAYNPFGQDVFDSRVRMVPLGQRRSTEDIDRFAATGGLRGELGRRLSWEASAGVAGTRGVYQFDGTLFLDGLRAALGPSFRDSGGVLRCGTPAAPITNCTPINYFALPDDPDAVAALRNLVTSTRDLSEQALVTYSAHLSGPVVRLPAGPAAFAAGVERREEWLEIRPDYLSWTGRKTGNKRAPTEGELDVNEVFGELSVPLLAALPGVERLEAGVGVRHSRYSFSESTTNGQLRVRWRPIAGLVIQGSYADVFRHPAIEELFPAPSTSRQFFADPCRGVRTPVGADPNIDRACAGVSRDGSFRQTAFSVPTTLQSNPDVGVEHGAATTWGATFAPRFYPPLGLSLNVWSLELDGTFALVNPAQRLHQCFTRGRFCDTFARDPKTGQVTRALWRGENAGRSEARGVDLGVRLASLDSWLGPITYSLLATRLSRSDRESFAGDPDSRVEQAGRLGDFGNFARWRALSSLEWGEGPLRAGLRSLYIHDVSEDPNDRGVRRSAGECAEGVTVEPSGAVCRRFIGSYLRHDLSGTYSYAPLKLALSLGVDNLLDRQPPRAYSGFNSGTDVSTYDTVGRFFWARLRVSF